IQTRWHFIPPSIGTLRVVTHTRLSKFHVACTTAGKNDAVFGHLTLPALRSLSYMGDSYHFWPRPSNVAFLHDRLPILTSQEALVTLQLNHFGDEDAGSNTFIPYHPLPALTFLTVVVLPRQLKGVKRLVQSRSTKQAKKSLGIRVQTKQWDDQIHKDEHAALFKDFVHNDSFLYSMQSVFGHPDRKTVIGAP
ncbi:hypothetical protein CPB85DRAFT_1300409, partial [Mucidula mucida]